MSRIRDVGFSVPRRLKYFYGPVWMAYALQCIKIHSHKFQKIYRFANNSFFLFFVMANWMLNYLVDWILAELLANNSEFYKFFPIYLLIFSKTFFFLLLSCGIEIFGPNNSKLFPNYIWILLKSQTFNLAELNPNN